MKYFLWIWVIIVTLTVAMPACADVADSKIAFVTTEDGMENIYSMNPDSSNKMQLTTAGGSYLPSISRDGTLIVYSADAEDGTQIWVMNADGSKKRQITKTGSNYNPDISPDNTVVVFHSIRDENRELYLINIDGTNEKRLTKNTAEDRNLAFSPDGKTIVYQSMAPADAVSGAQNWEIFTMNVDGTQIQQLTNHPANDTDPMFSPDGKQIVFVSNRDYNENIYIMNADGSQVTKVTSNPGNECNPCFSPDGKSIVFNTSRDQGSHEIYIINTDGTKETRVTNNHFYDWYPVWGKATPNVN